MKNSRKYLAFLMLFALLFCVGCSGGDKAAAPADGNAAYTVKIVDQNGEAVEGAAIQVCSDSTCMLYTSDAQGLCSFELPAAEYEVHILKLPEGYAGDTDTTKTLSAAGGELEFRLEKQ